VCCSGGPETVPLFPGLGTHYVDVFVGTPPQRQSVIVDTGRWVVPQVMVGQGRALDLSGSVSLAAP
jgi:hypothetical protein